MQTKLAFHLLLVLPGKPGDSAATGGSGTFTYTYDDKDNVKTASNGIVKETYTRGGYGNVTRKTTTHPKINGRIPPPTGFCRCP